MCNTNNKHSNMSVHHTRKMYNIPIRYDHFCADARNMYTWLSLPCSGDIFYYSQIKFLSKKLMFSISLSTLFYNVSTHYIALDVCEGCHVLQCTLTQDTWLWVLPGFAQFPVLPSITRLKAGLNRFAGKTGFSRAKVEPCLLWVFNVKLSPFCNCYLLIFIRIGRGPGSWCLLNLCLTKLPPPQGFFLTL